MAITVNTNWNDIRKTGKYRSLESILNESPDEDGLVGRICEVIESGSTIIQTMIAISGSIKYTRTYSGSWNDWTVLSEQKVQGTAVSGQISLNFGDDIDLDFNQYRDALVMSGVNAIFFDGDVDSNGFAHVVGIDASTEEMCYANNISGSWTVYNSSVFNDIIDTRAELLRVLVDSTDIVHAIYRHSSGNLHHATINTNTGVWSTEVVSSLITQFGYIDAKLDENDKLHVCSVNTTLAAGQNVYYSTNASGSWVTSVVASNYQMFTNYKASIAVNSLGHVYVAYFTDLGIFRVMSNKTGPWTQILALADTGLGAAMAFDTKDVLNIVHHNQLTSQTVISYIFPDDTHIIDEEGVAGLSTPYNSIVVDNKDNFWVFKYDSTKAKMEITTKSEKTTRYYFRPINPSYTPSYSRIILKNNRLYSIFSDAETVNRINYTEITKPLTVTNKGNIYQVIGTGRVVSTIESGDSYPGREVVFIFEKEGTLITNIGNIKLPYDQPIITHAGQTLKFTEYSAGQWVLSGGDTEVNLQRRIWSIGKPDGTWINGESYNNRKYEYNHLTISGNVSTRAKLIIVNGDLTLNTGAVLTLEPLHQYTLSNYGGLFDAGSTLAGGDVGTNIRGSKSGSGIGGYGGMTSRRNGETGSAYEVGWKFGNGGGDGGRSESSVYFHGGGGAYGGDGRHASANGGEGGGGGCGGSGAGGTAGFGGALCVFAVRGNFIFNGKIVSNGSNATNNNNGGGGGGGVYITCHGYVDHTSGTGEFEFIGGNSHGTGGGGGGGFVRVHAVGEIYDHAVNTITSQTDVSGGSGGLLTALSSGPTATPDGNVFVGRMLSTNDFRFGHTGFLRHAWS